MHGKPACFYDSCNLSGMKMEETIRKWLEDKLEDLELVEGDLKKHVRTFVGIFRLSRQDLVQDIKEEPQYPQAVRRYMDAQYSLEDLRKSVFVFEFMKLTCLKKEEANRIVDELFAEWNLIAGENLKEEKEDLSQKRPLSQPTCRSEPVSRSELETSYRSAFPALPPKGNKPKVPSEPIHSFWEQRSPLRSNPSVQSSRNKIGAQGSLTDKAPTLVPKKIRIGGKENECSPACTEPKKKTGKSREVRSRRESSNSSSQSPKSSEDQYLEKLSRDLKIYLGVNGSGKEAAKEPTKKKEMESQSSAAPAPTSEEEKGISLNPFPEPSVWDPDYVTEYPLWGSSHWVEDSAWCTPPNQRSASEPHFAKQELGMEGCGLPKRTLTCSDSISSSPSPVQDADPPVVDNPSLALKSSGLGECSSDLDLSALVPASSTSITSSHFDCLFLTGSIWSNSHLAGEEWPASKLDIPTPQSMNLEQATSLSPMPEKAEQQACGCPSDVGHHADYTVDHNTQQRLDHDPGVYGQSDGAYVAYSSQPSADCWGHQQADSSYESAEEEATVSSDSDSWKVPPHESLCFSFVDKPSIAQEDLNSATVSDVQDPEQHPAPLAMESNSQATSPTVIERAIDQIFPEHTSDCHYFDQEFQREPHASNHASLHNHLPPTNSSSCPTSNMQSPVPECPSFECTCDNCRQQISNLWHSFFNSPQNHSAPVPFPSQPHTFSLLEGIAQNLYQQRPEPNSESFIWMQPFQSPCSLEDVKRKLLSALYHHHCVMVDPSQESELDHDSFGIRKFASTLEESSQNDWEGSLKDVQFSLKAYDLDNVRTRGLASLFEDSSHRSWEECIKDPESLFMDNDLSSSPHFTRHSSFAVSSQQSCCSCEGACNCQSVLPVKFSLGSGEEDGPDIVHFYHPQRASHSCMQASQNVMKSASDSNLGHESDHKSAFRKVSSISFPSLVWPCLAHVADLFDAPSEPRTTTTCLIEDASACQLEKIKKNSLRVINPDLTKPAEPEETAVPDPSIFDHPDVYGGDCPEVVMAVPSYLLKESKETQTSHGDSEPGPSVLPSPPASPPQKPEYEEKRWKDLKPLSAEDVQRDLLHAAISAQKEGIPHSDLLDVAVLEGYDFADFQLMTETSASALVPQNQAVYVKDLEKAWLSESYRRLGKNKGRRPLHPNKPCSFYLEGCCYRFDCKFSHDIDTITCQFWEVGQCFKGDLCPFLHGYFGGFSASDGGEEFDVSKEDFPELTKKDMRLNSAPASKKRKNKKNSIHRLQLPRGT